MAWFGFWIFLAVVICCEYAPDLPRSVAALIRRRIAQADTPVGLTKREYFTAKAMQGLLSGDILSSPNPADTAQNARKYADALLIELNSVVAPDETG